MHLCPLAPASLARSLPGLQKLPVANPVHCNLVSIAQTASLAPRLPGRLSCFCYTFLLVEDSILALLAEPSTAPAGLLSRTGLPRRRRGMVQCLSSRSSQPKALTKSQIMTAYKAELREYRLIQEELAPWTKAFQAQHLRKPTLADVESTGKEPVVRAAVGQPPCGALASSHVGHLPAHMLGTCQLTCGALASSRVGHLPAHMWGTCQLPCEALASSHVGHCQLPCGLSILQEVRGCGIKQ